MDYADLRMLNMMLQFLLLLTVIKYFLQKNLTGYLFPFAMSLIVLNPVSTAMSLQFSSIYYIVLLSMLIILKKHEYFYQKNLYPYLFFGLGIITVYFDFLTYPLAALCTPLILATVYKGNIIKNLIMDCQSYTKYRPNETTGGIFVSWRRKEELPTGA